MNGIRLQESEINFVFCEWSCTCVPPTRKRRKAPKKTRTQCPCLFSKNVTIYFFRQEQALGYVERNSVFEKRANIVRPYALYSQFGGPRKALAF